MIRDVAELRERGQVCRRVDELSVPVEQWRAGIRAAARREGLRIRTFLVDPTDPDTADSDPAAQLVYAVLAERTSDPQALSDALPATMTTVAPLADATTPTAELSQATAGAAPVAGSACGHWTSSPCRSPEQSRPIRNTTTGTVPIGVSSGRVGGVPSTGPGDPRRRGRGLW